MSDAEQVLACLHADALLLKSRLELKLGMQEAAAKATARQQRLQATLQKRDQQADIFGARTRKERRLDAAAVEGAGRMPQTASVGVVGTRGLSGLFNHTGGMLIAVRCHCVMQEVEQRLLLECGRCPYQRAMALTASAITQPDSSRQAALLEVRVETASHLQCTHMCVGPAAHRHTLPSVSKVEKLCPTRLVAPS